MRTWTYQQKRQVEKVGADAAPWYVGWYDPDGRKRCRMCGKGRTGKRDAGRLAERIKAELLTGTYDDTARKTWKRFREEYDRTVLATLGAGNRKLTERSLRHFERIVRPQRMSSITSENVARFAAGRERENGPGGRPLSRATVNLELRHLRAVFNFAAEWGFVDHAPKVRMLKVGRKLPVWVTPDHFAAMYAACDTADRPDLPNVAAADWWRGLLTYCYMTGWRIGQVLAMQWENVDMDTGRVYAPASDTKGKRDVLQALHPVVVDHLHRVRSFHPLVFSDALSERRLYQHFHRLQDAADVRPERSGKPHYGFHDLRRAFATMNADRLTADALQSLMQHTSYQTTQGYIHMARQINAAVDDLYVPDALRPAANG